MSAESGESEIIQWYRGVVVCGVWWCCTYFITLLSVVVQHSTVQRSTVVKLSRVCPVQYCGLWDTARMIVLFLLETSLLDGKYYEQRRESLF